MAAAEMVELWRNGLLESTHRGHAVICDAAGEVIESWGDLAAVIFPRSSCKMLQALPLVESGAADAAGLTRGDILTATDPDTVLRLIRDAFTNPDRVAA